jgi:hypothetical protein
MATAASAAIASAPSGRDRDALSAFVLAWRRQWPRSFARAFGANASSVAGWADAAVTDASRYIKLSRIAMAHLATIL